MLYTLTFTHGVCNLISIKLEENKWNKKIKEGNSERICTNHSPSPLFNLHSSSVSQKSDLEVANDQLFHWKTQTWVSCWIPKVEHTSERHTKSELAHRHWESVFNMNLAVSHIWSSQHLFLPFLCHRPWQQEWAHDLGRGGWVSKSANHNQQKKWAESWISDCHQLWLFHKSHSQTTKSLINLGSSSTPLGHLVHLLVTVVLFSTSYWIFRNFENQLFKCWHLEVGPPRNIYTTEIGKHLSG